MSTAAKLKRTEDPKVRRAQILAAAQGCFCDTGFHPTTMAQIAARAGLSVGLIYQFFAGKEALIEGIVTDDFERQIAWLERQPADVPLDLYAFCARMDEQDPGAVNLTLEIAAELARNPALAEVVRTKQRESIRLLVDRMRSSLPHGGGPDLEERLRLIIGLHFGIRMQIAIEGVDGKERLVAMARKLGRDIAAARTL